MINSHLMWSRAFIYMAGYIKCLWALYYRPFILFFVKLQAKADKDNLKKKDQNQRRVRWVFQGVYRTTTSRIDREFAEKGKEILRVTGVWVVQPAADGVQPWGIPTIISIVYVYICFYNFTDLLMWFQIITLAYLHSRPVVLSPFKHPNPYVETLDEKKWFSSLCWIKTAEVLLPDYVHIDSGVFIFFGLSFKR